jgi:hypothetical protein
MYRDPEALDARSYRNRRAQQGALSGALGGSADQTFLTDDSNELQDQGLGGTSQPPPRNARTADFRDEGPQTAPGAGGQTPSPGGAPAGGTDAASQLQQPVRQAGTSRLMESTHLLGDPEQMKKSPKAAFLSNADKYGYNEGSQLLKDLQANADYGRFFQGWQMGGKNGDILHYAGDPSQLASEWGGITSFDAIGGYDPVTGQATGWRWGVGEGGLGAQTPQMRALGSAVAGPGFGAPMDPFMSQNRGQEDLSSVMSRNTQTGGDALQAIYKILGGIPGGLGSILQGIGL